MLSCYDGIFSRILLIYLVYARQVCSFAKRCEDVDTHCKYVIQNASESKSPLMTVTINSRHFTPSDLIVLDEEDNEIIASVEYSRIYKLKCTCKSQHPMQWSTNLISTAQIEDPQNWTNWAQFSPFSNGTKATKPTQWETEIIITELTPSAGFIRCSSIFNDSVSTAVYVFFPDPDNPFVDDYNETLYYVNKTDFIVPCRVTGPKYYPKLEIQLAFNKSYYELKLDHGPIWDNRVGFYVHAGNNSSLFRQNYRCTLGNYEKRISPQGKLSGKIYFNFDNSNYVDCFQTKPKVPLLSITRSIYPCSTSPQCDIDAMTGALHLRHDVISQPAREGIFYCYNFQLRDVKDERFRRDLVFTKFFQGFDRTYILPGKYPSSAVMKLKGAPKVLHTNMIYYLQCDIKTFALRVRGAFFVASLKDGRHKVLGKQSDDDGTYSDEYRRIYFSSSVVHRHMDEWSSSNVASIQYHMVAEKNMVEIICTAPKYDHLEWVTARSRVDVRDMQSPSIVGRTKVIVFVLGSRDQKISCYATAEPEAKINWTLPEKVSPFLKIEPSGILSFALVDESAPGTYTCIAWNGYGNDTFEYEVRVEVSWKKWSSVLAGVAVIITVAFFSVLTIIMIRHHRFRQKLQDFSPDEVNRFLHGDASAEMSGYVGGSVDALRLPFLQTVNSEDLLMGGEVLLGHGESGAVYRGLLNGYPVAVKASTRTATVEHARAMLDEVKIMAFVGSHANIVKFLGADVSEIHKRTIRLVMELSPHGSLLKFLRNLKPLSLYEGDRNQLSADGVVHGCGMESQLVVSTVHLLDWCMQIADGMKHLGKKRIVHGDLAARNVLVFQDNVVKLTDFGLSKSLCERTTYTSKKKVSLPWRWSAPELLQSSEFSVQGDVWSYAVLLWEIFTLGAVPYAHASSSDKDKLLQRLSSGERLPQPGLADDDSYSIMLQCWNLNKSSRPTFSHLHAVFNKKFEMMKKLPSSNRWLAEV